MHYASAALEELQKQMRGEYVAKEETYRLEKAKFETDRKNWAHAPDGTKVLGGDPPAEPRPPRMAAAMATDATWEALAADLEANPRGIVLKADELTGWARSMNQY